MFSNLDKTQKYTLTLAIAAVAGLWGLGYAIHGGLYNLRGAADRYVTVRGLAERDLPANLALWPVRFTVAADTLEGLQAELEADQRTIGQYLIKAGFKAAEISTNLPAITDKEAGWSENRQGPRYFAEGTVVLRTADVARVQTTVEKIGDLVKQGVALSSNWGLEYFYTDLETIKPEMIAEATQDARRAAEKFADDSGSSVGNIRNAQQGLFSIEAKDQFAQDTKRVRVVTTVQYYLTD